MTNLDTVFAHATVGAAGELQMESAEVGIEHVAESDLRRAFRRALQMQLGPFVRPEGAAGFKLPQWPRIGKPDLLVIHPDDRAWRAFGEAKWCRENTMFEILWDLLKMSLAISLDRIEAGYIIVGAPEPAWVNDSWRCSALAETETWDTRELLKRYERDWRSLLKVTTTRPTRLPLQVSTTLLTTVPIHLVGRDNWELRLVRVDDPGTGLVKMDDGWPAGG
jgi:hypothetical protein